MQVQLSAAMPQHQCSPLLPSHKQDHNNAALTPHSLLAKAFTVSAKCVTLAILPPRMSQMLQAWQAGMLTEAPIPDKLMPGRLQAYSHILRQLFSEAGS